MDWKDLVPLVVAVIGIGFTITASLIAVIFRWLKRTVDKNEEKLDKDIGNLRDKIDGAIKSFTHRIETLRSEVTGLQTMILQDLLERKKEAANDADKYTDLLKRYLDLKDFIDRDK